MLWLKRQEMPACDKDEIKSLMTKTKARERKVQQSDSKKSILLIQIPAFRISWDVTYMFLLFFFSAVEFVSFSSSACYHGGFCVEFFGNPKSRAASTGFVEFPPQGEFQNDMKHGSCAQILFLFLMENPRDHLFHQEIAGLFKTKP